MALLQHLHKKKILILYICDVIIDLHTCTRNKRISLIDTTHLLILIYLYILKCAICVEKDYNELILKYEPVYEYHAKRRENSYWLPHEGSKTSCTYAVCNHVLLDLK